MFSKAFRRAKVGYVKSREDNRLVVWAGNGVGGSSIVSWYLSPVPVLGQDSLSRHSQI